MKKVIGILLITGLIIGCAAERYGSGIDPTAQKVKVKDIILYPEFQGKTVSIEGKITSQCMSNGCWFFLQDETGQVFVNLGPNNFSLPANMGRTATVTGTTAATKDGFQIIASGVEVR